MHSVDGDEVGLHSPLLVELQLFVFCSAQDILALPKCDCTNHPYLLT